MRRLPTLALLTLVTLGAAASCGDAQDTDSAGAAAGEGGAAGGDGPTSGSGGSSHSGKGGIASGGSDVPAPTSGNGGMDQPGGNGGMDPGGSGGMDLLGGSGGSAHEEPPLLPGHASTICDPQASYPAPLPPAASRTATRLSEAYFFTEGPVWVASGGYLLFTELYNVGVAPYVPGAHIRRFTPPSTFDTFITDSDSNGLALSADGLTLFAARRIKANANDGEIASYPIASKVKATVLSSPVNPNDLAARSDHNLYFSDGDVYRIDPNNNVTKAAQVAAESANGVTLSPDERTLYTGWSDGKIYATALALDGTPGAQAPFATLQEAGHPDGMAVDCAGNLYAADYSNGAVQVFDNAGQYLGRLTLPAAAGASPAAEHATNVAFGGADHRTLFITAHRGDWNDPAIGELHSIALNVPGLPY